VERGGGGGVHTRQIKQFKRPEISNSDTVTCWGGKSQRGKMEGLPPELLNTRREFQRTVRWMTSFYAPKGGSCLLRNTVVVGLPSRGVLMRAPGAPRDAAGLYAFRGPIPWNGEWRRGGGVTCPSPSPFEGPGPGAGLPAADLLLPPERPQPERPLRHQSPRAPPPPPLPPLSCPPSVPSGAVGPLHRKICAWDLHSRNNADENIWRLRTTPKRNQPSHFSSVLSSVGVCVCVQV